MHICDAKDPRRALRPPHVHVEAVLPGFGRPRHHAEGLHQAGVEALPGKIECAIHLDRVGKDGVGLLALSAAQEGGAQASMRLGQVVLGLHPLLRVGDRRVPHLELREGGRAVAKQQCVLEGCLLGGLHPGDCAGVGRHRHSELGLGHRLVAPLLLVVRGLRVARGHQPADHAVERLDIAALGLQLHSTRISIDGLLQGLGGLRERRGGVADLPPRLLPLWHQLGRRFRVHQRRPVLAEVGVAVGALRQQDGGGLTPLRSVLQGVRVQNCSVPQIPPHDRGVSQPLPRHRTRGPVRFLPVLALGEDGCVAERPRQNVPRRAQEHLEAGLLEDWHEGGLEVVPVGLVLLGGAGHGRDQAGKHRARLDLPGRHLRRL
mmetsp:Transcript_45360/g.122101  ORF Transcript_45360/g.122101 Transcript_45360/m.122101 type:complete len:375 (-) Transcript_45360:1664-2788(-)